MDELYKQYGELIFQLEILQAQIAHIKQRLAEEYNKKQQSKQDEEE